MEMSCLADYWGSVDDSDLEPGERYLANIARLVSRIHTSQHEPMKRVAEIIADSMAHGNLLHVFGTGHFILTIAVILEMR